MFYKVASKTTYDKMGRGRKGKRERELRERERERERERFGLSVVLFEGL